MSATQIRDRINQYLQVNNISRLAFAKTAGLNPSTIQKQLSGASALSAETIDGLAFNYPVNVSWLLLGTGPMDLTPIPDPSTVRVSADHVADVSPRATQTADENNDNTMSIADALAVIKSQQQIIEHQAEMLENLVRKMNTPK